MYIQLVTHAHFTVKRRLRKYTLIQRYYTLYSQTQYKRTYNQKVAYNAIRIPIYKYTYTQDIRHHITEDRMKKVILSLNKIAK